MTLVPPYRTALPITGCPHTKQTNSRKSSSLERCTTVVPSPTHHIQVHNITAPTDNTPSVSTRHESRLSTLCTYHHPKRERKGGRSFLIGQFVREEISCGGRNTRQEPGNSLRAHDTTECVILPPCSLQPASPKKL